MSYTPYRIFALISPDAGIDFSQVVDEIGAKYRSVPSAPGVERSGNQCMIRRNDWVFRLYWEDAPYVLEDSREIAEHAEVGANERVIASCSRRITTAGDPDPNMMYFNDYVRVLEVLESFEGVYLYDPYDGKFLEQDDKSL